MENEGKCYVNYLYTFGNLRYMHTPTHYIVQNKKSIQNVRHKW